MDHSLEDIKSVPYKTTPLNNDEIDVEGKKHSMH